MLVIPQSGENPGWGRNSVLFSSACNTIIMDFNVGSSKRVEKNKSSFSWQFGSEPNMLARSWWMLI